MVLKTVSDFYKNYFGEKVYKISLDAGCTCPNRDGKLGYGGCIFCSEKGSGEFAADRKKTIYEQIEMAIKKVESKCSSKRYIAYFQNFTNTYGNLDEIFKKWDQAISVKEIVGLSIATRPDCLSKKVLDRLAYLANKTFVQLEFGFQTSNETTARYIRRGFENQVYERAVKDVHNACDKIHVVTHIIFGLPGENEKDMLETVKKTLCCGSDGLKITVLYVLKGTDLEKDYAVGNVRILNKDEYFSVLEKALFLIQDKMVIHRVTGDPPKSLLIEPKWTANKKLVMNDCKNLFLHVNSLLSDIIK